jgi:hypothetical protein
MTGVPLGDVKEISNPEAPLADQFFIASTSIKSWTPSPTDSKIANINGEGESDDR